MPNRGWFGGVSEHQQLARRQLRKPIPLEGSEGTSIELDPVLHGHGHWHRRTNRWRSLRRDHQRLSRWDGQSQGIGRREPNRRQGRR